MHYFLLLFFLAPPLHSAPPTHSLESLAEQHDAFLLDAYGVFWGSDVGVMPGAAEAMEYLVSKGKYVGILSNTTQLSRKEQEKLKKYGLHEGVHYHFILTSGEAAKELLNLESLPFATPRKTFWVFGTQHPRYGSMQLYEGTNYRETENLEEADFIHLAAPHINGIDQEDPEVFREAVRKVAGQTPIFCVNPDCFALEGTPQRHVVRQGSLARLFTEEGTPVHYVGKPSTFIYEAALRRLPPHLQKEKVLMIGDTPGTDIRGAHGLGLPAALVIKTGIMASSIEKNGAAAIEQLPSTDQPDFLLERLGLEPAWGF